MQSLKLEMWRLLQVRSSLTFRQTVECRFTETRTWYDKNMQSNVPYISFFTTQVNHLASVAKWFCVHLSTKWLWFWVPLLSLKPQIWRLLQARNYLIFRQTVDFRFTLKLVRDMIITYSQMHRTDKYSQHSSIIWPVSLIG